MVEAVRQDLPKLRALVCLDQELPFAPSFDRWLSGLADDHHQRDTIDDLAMIPGTGGTTGKPKGVMLSGRNIEAMTALTLMGYPFKGRPVYLAPGAADARRRRAVLPDHDARRPRRDHASP